MFFTAKKIPCYTVCEGHVNEHINKYLIRKHLRSTFDSQLIKQLV